MNSQPPHPPSHLTDDPMMSSSSLLSSALPYPTIDGDARVRLEEAERSRDWWKHRVSVLDLRCREINAELREALAENKRYRVRFGPHIPHIMLRSRLEQENERLATELHLYRMRMIAEQLLQKIGSKLPDTPPLTPQLSPRTSPFISYPLSPPQTPTTPGSPTQRARRQFSPSRMNTGSPLL